MSHNDSGDIMNEKDLWLLFQKTGKIEYYLRYKYLKEASSKNDKESRRNYR